MRYINKLLLLPLLLACSASMANTSVSIGSGAQHGGSIGTQLAFYTNSKKHKFHSALALIGIGMGYEYFLSPSVSLGASMYDYNFLSRFQGKVLHANYYFNSSSKRGLWIGVDFIKEEVTDWKTHDVSQDSKTGVSLGYRF